MEMSISEEMRVQLLEQVNMELRSAYLYLGMASEFAHAGLHGMAWWSRLQWKEELHHALKLLDYLHQRNAPVELSAIEAPESGFADAAQVFEHALRHEQRVTASVNALVDRAIDENDNATQAYLDWYVSEQVEEEAQLAHILKQLGMAGAQGHGLILLDRELGSREASTPPMKKGQGFWK